jgi:hypothetical protein
VRKNSFSNVDLTRRATGSFGPKRDAGGGKMGGRRHKKAVLIIYKSRLIFLSWQGIIDARLRIIYFGWGIVAASSNRAPAFIPVTSE